MEFSDRETLSDLLDCYLSSGGTIDRRAWQDLDDESRTWLSCAIVNARPRTSSRVVVAEYDERWPRTFALIERQLREVLGALALAIEHVGSTSVLGLAAKPIIDIELVIASTLQFLPVKERLEKFGYIHRGPCGVPGRETFRCIIDLPWHHLYVCVIGAVPLREHLQFRDRLRANPDVAAAYAALKRELAALYPNDRDAYTEAKTDFIRSQLADAKYISR